jgi:hypothetical protein
MKVKLDLRPRSLVEAGGKRVNAKRVLLVALFLAFILVGGVTFALTFLKVQGMRSDVSLSRSSSMMLASRGLRGPPWGVPSLVSPKRPPVMTPASR